MIEVKDVSFSYDKEPVLKNVGLALAPGKFYAVVGPNGSGKTTLIRLLSRLSLPDSGQLFLDGKSYAEFERRDFARQLAMLPQSRPVPAISVRSWCPTEDFPISPCPGSFRRRTGGLLSGRCWRQGRKVWPAGV